MRFSCCCLLFIPRFRLIQKRKIFLRGIFISVILPVRNEEKNIAICLESLDELNYPKEKFEIILVNDHSTDQNEKYSGTIFKADSKLTLLDNLPEAEGKKSAIATGIKRQRRILSRQPTAIVLFRQIGC